MTDATGPILVRVSHRFDASAERVYDAFLDPALASRFLFTTPTGQIVRCEIDATVNGGFTIVDRRHGEDVVHIGTYIALDRPRRIAFDLRVEKYSSEHSRVTIEIVPGTSGCEVTLTHELRADDAPYRDRTQAGWGAILGIAAEVLAEPATCGAGVAQHASIPLKLADMFDGLSETLDLHRTMLVTTADEHSRREDAVYQELATQWRQIASLVRTTARMMREQRELPMGAHDESAWGERHLRAFEQFVTSQSQVLALLRVAAEHDEQMLASMKSPADQRS